MASWPSAQPRQSGPLTIERPWRVPPTFEQLTAKYHADVARLRIEQEYLRSIERSHDKPDGEHNEYLFDLHPDSLRKEYEQWHGLPNPLRNTRVRQPFAGISSASTIHEQELARTTSRDFLPYQDARGSGAARRQRNVYPEDDKIRNRNQQESRGLAYTFRSPETLQSPKTWFLPSESEEDTEEESSQRRIRASAEEEQPHRADPRELMSAGCTPRRFPRPVRRFFEYSSQPQRFSAQRTDFQNRRPGNHKDGSFVSQNLRETQHEGEQGRIAHSRSAVQALHISSLTNDIREGRNAVIPQLQSDDPGNATPGPPKLPLWRCYCPHVYLCATLTMVTSLIVSIVLSIAKRDMSDGFTVGGYLIAVGSVIVGVLVAKHNDICIKARYKPVSAAAS